MTDRLAALTRPVPAPRATQRPVTPPTVPFVRVSSEARDCTPGDKVCITNRLGHAQGRPATAKDRAAVVGTVVPGNSQRAEFRTLNGYCTWRAAKNLRRLTEEECQAHRDAP